MDISAAVLDSVSKRLSTALDGAMATAAGLTLEQVAALPRWQQEWLASQFELQIVRNDLATETHWLFDRRLGRRVSGVRLGPLVTKLEDGALVMQTPVTEVEPLSHSPLSAGRLWRSPLCNKAHAFNEPCFLCGRVAPATTP